MNYWSINSEINRLSLLLWWQTNNFGEYCHVHSLWLDKNSDPYQLWKVDCRANGRLGLETFYQSMIRYNSQIKDDSRNIRQSSVNLYLSLRYFDIQLFGNRLKITNPLEELQNSLLAYAEHLMIRWKFFYTTFSLFKSANCTTSHHYALNVTKRIRACSSYMKYSIRTDWWKFSFQNPTELAFVLKIAYTFPIDK